jgi:hypothetical protein
MIKPCPIRGTTTSIPYGGPEPGWVCLHPSKPVESVKKRGDKLCSCCGRAADYVYRGEGLCDKCCWQMAASGEFQ